MEDKLLNKIINILEDMINECDNREQQRILARAIVRICMETGKKYDDGEQMSLFDYL